MSMGTAAGSGVGMGTRSVGSVVRPRVHMGPWEGLVEEAGSLGGRLADVLGGEEGPEAQATAASALGSLFRFWSEHPLVDSSRLRRPWVVSEALPGLLWLAGDHGVSQATRLSALAALKGKTWLQDELVGPGLMLAKQRDALRQAALSAALHPDEPFHEELLRSVLDLMPRWKYHLPQALQPSLVSVIRKIRLADDGQLEGRLGLWKGFSVVLFDLARESAAVLDVEGAMQELLHFIEALDHLDFCHTRRLLGSEARSGFLVKGGAGFVVGALRWGLDRYNHHQASQVSQWWHPAQPFGVLSAQYADEVGKLVGELGELLNPQLVRPAAALTPARVLEDAGLGGVLPDLRRLRDQNLPHPVPADAAALRAKLDAFLQHYHNALHPSPPVSSPPTSTIR